MPDTAKSLDIVILSTADTAGVKDATEALDNLSDAAKRSNQASTEAAGALEKLQAQGSDKNPSEFNQRKLENVAASVSDKVNAAGHDPDISASKSARERNDLENLVQIASSETNPAGQEKASEGGDESSAHDTARKSLLDAQTGEEISQDTRIAREAASSQKTGGQTTIPYAEQLLANIELHKQALEAFISRLMGALDKMPDFRTYEARLQALEKKMPDMQSQLRSSNNDITNH